LSAGYAQIAHAAFAIVVEVADGVDSCFWSIIGMNLLHGKRVDRDGPTTRGQLCNVTWRKSDFQNTSDNSSTAKVEN
jgi:hypothetical protein